MGYDKVIDSAKLDADLTTVAGAIRAKAGSTGEMAFPNGYVSALEPLVNGEDYLADVINKTCSELVNSKITTITTGFQQDNKNLWRVELPAAVTSGESTFTGCSNMTVFKMPALKKVTSGAFANMPKMTSFYFPSLETMKGWGYNFNQDKAVERIYFPKLTSEIGNSEFNNCLKLTALILGADSVCTLSNVNAFGYTPINRYNNTIGYIYVPRALVDSYKTATNWSNYADQIRAIEDYPEVLEGWE